MGDDSGERAQRIWRLHADLLRLRREDATIALQGSRGFDGATLDERGLTVRFFGPRHDDRLLIVNLGDELDLVSRAVVIDVSPNVDDPGRAWTPEQRGTVALSSLVPA